MIHLTVSLSLEERRLVIVVGVYLETGRSGVKMFTPFVRRDGLIARQKKIHIMKATMELVFGYGRWQYLGKNVALIELKKVFVEVTLPSKCQRREELMKYYSCYSILNCLLCIH